MMHALYDLMFLYVLTCLGQNAHGSEIINGKNVPENLMLYMASVQNHRGHICGGFLVSSDFVITAAHCDKHNPSTVVLGTHNLSAEDAMTYSVTERCRYPHFQNAASGDDIMLLKLSEEVRLDNKVQLIQLQKMKVKDKAKCRVAGWGFTKTGGKVVDVLKAVEVPIVNLKDCKKRWKQLPNNVTCAGGYGTDKGFCQGDSGGPLVCGGMAVGIASYNMYKNCDYPNVPNVYTDVSKYLPWIKKILRQKHC